MSFDPDSVIEIAAAVVQRATHVLLTWPSESTPLAAVILVPFAALIFHALRDVRRLSRFRFRRVLRIVLAKRYLGHRSHFLDVMLMAGNIGIFALICAQATISMTSVSAMVYAGLGGLFGVSEPSTLGVMKVGTVWAVALFLAYEFAYWLDHYLSHNIAFLWEFHKVHHSAEVLSPLTNFRVHPVDSLVFVNIVALTNGVAAGVLHQVFGAGPVRLEWFNYTTLIALAVTVFAQLQHTHIWIPLTGFWGRIVLSPAHHQIHHSVDVTHYNKNLGNLIAVFDWMFGTLHIPSKKRPKLVFGLGEATTPAHDLNEGLVRPFVDAAKHLTPTATLGQSVSA